MRCVSSLKNHFLLQSAKDIAVGCSPAGLSSCHCHLISSFAVYSCYSLVPAVLSSAGLKYIYFLLFLLQICEIYYFYLLCMCRGDFLYPRDWLQLDLVSSNCSVSIFLLQAISIFCEVYLDCQKIVLSNIKVNLPSNMFFSFQLNGIRSASSVWLSQGLYLLQKDTCIFFAQFSIENISST